MDKITEEYIKLGLMILGSLYFLGLMLFLYFKFGKIEPGDKEQETKRT